MGPGPKSTWDKWDQVPSTCDQWEQVPTSKATSPPDTHPVVFDSIQGKTIRAAALRTEGTAGPSGIDAHG